MWTVNVLECSSGTGVGSEDSLPDSEDSLPDSYYQRRPFMTAHHLFTEYTKQSNVSRVRVRVKKGLE